MPKTVIGRRLVVSLAFLAGLGLAGQVTTAQAQGQGLFDKKCLNCHTEYKGKAGVVGGEFQSRSMKAKSVQVKVGQRNLIIKFTAQTQVANVPNIKALKKPIPVMVTFVKKGSDMVATLIKAKPKMKVPKDQLIDAQAVARLVAMGPAKGKYTLVDSRPGIRYQEGHIPTAIAIPFPAMPQKMNLLPKDKKSLVIFYCGGFR
jgi:hypothetical protein